MIDKPSVEECHHDEFNVVENICRKLKVRPSAPVQNTRTTTVPLSMLYSPTTDIIIIDIIIITRILRQQRRQLDDARQREES
jgi:hypothetical protein